jgi:signal transduction histidine kinase
VSNSRRILLLDADAKTLEILQTMLTRHGFAVRVAADGAAGLRLARAEQPALIVLDLFLGGIDGAEVCRRLKEDEATRDITILLHSALDLPAPNEPWQPTELADWQSLPYDALLQKPVELNHFIRVVERLVYPNRSTLIPAGPSVILAIPNAGIRQRLQKDLTGADYKVRAFDDIQTGVRTFHSRPPAAVVIDGSLLTSAAWSDLMAVRQRTPVMALVMLLDTEQAIPPESTAQIDGFLRPPYHSEDLLVTIAWTLKRRRLRQQVRELSHQILRTRQELLESQQALRAQNNELSLVNEQLRQVDKLKETLTGMLVHDLKSPMAAVIGALHFALMDPSSQVSDTSQHFLKAALAAGNQMTRLADTLLDEQRLEAGQLKLDTEPVDVQDLIDASIEQIAALLLMNKLEIEQDVDHDLPPILADRVITQRVLENLLDNAIKYSPPEEIIRISAHGRHDFVEFSVVDRGPGVPPADRDFIFKRFAQLTEQQMHSPRKGFGLGLAFCHLAVTAMDGKIWVDSPPDKGTAFHFDVPIHQE